MAAENSNSERAPTTMSVIKCSAGGPTKRSFADNLECSSRQDSNLNLSKQLTSSNSSRPLKTSPTKPLPLLYICILSVAFWAELSSGKYELRCDLTDENVVPSSRLIGPISVRGSVIGDRTKQATAVGANQAVRAPSSVAKLASPNSLVVVMPLLMAGKVLVVSVAVGPLNGMKNDEVKVLPPPVASEPLSTGLLM